MSRKQDEYETNKVLQEIRNEVIDFTTSNFFDNVVKRYQIYERTCFDQNKGNSLEFVKCMMPFQKRQLKEEKKMEFKINYIKNEIAECLQKKQIEQCKQSAINNIIQAQSDFLQSIDIELQK